MFRVSAAKCFLNRSFPSLISACPDGGSRRSRILQWWLNPSQQNKTLSKIYSLCRKQLCLPALFHASKQLFSTLKRNKLKPPFYSSRVTSCPPRLAISPRVAAILGVVSGRSSRHRSLRFCAPSVIMLSGFFLLRKPLYENQELLWRRKHPYLMVLVKIICKQFEVYRLFCWLSIRQHDHDVRILRSVSSAW